ncbi:hypothetical protein PR048_005380 [Dryococelus australis]|uniref:DDE Tnp4 domain-containing protein n=1 Tax=Dryococelus australis TaxID=614101 RepID=A0ABQ9I832_9NEOP|nr:hypothetical protein PR048_005380 [Dryococelus australis]
MERPNKGLFHNLFDDLQQHSVKFFSYFRMSKNSLYRLLSMIEESIRKRDTVMREAIPSDQRLALNVLGNWLQHERSMHRLSHRFINSIGDTSQSLYCHKGFIYGPVLSTYHSTIVILETAAWFEKRANFPHCVAAVSGKHIRIIKPNDSGSLKCNFKQFCSILLLAACDSNYRFPYIDVGVPGKASYSTTFKNTRFYSKLQSNKIKLPAPRPLLQQRPDQVPYVIIRVEGFGLSQFALRPYGGRFLTAEKKVFNYLIINFEHDFAGTIIKTCCLLHNFVKGTIWRLEEGMPVDNCNPGNNARCTSLLLTDYFMNEGALEWQMQ